MRKRIGIGGFAVVVATLASAAMPAKACEDYCGCGAYGYYAAPTYGYYARPAFAYYAPAVTAYYAAPVYFAAPAYHAPPAYYGPPVYRPYYGWRDSYVDAGHARPRGNVLAADAGARPSRTASTNAQVSKISKAPGANPAHARMSTADKMLKRRPAPVRQLIHAAWASGKMSRH
jgi:hypothetical protein